ncbi:MAG: elongation factor G [Planctomycetes bacterium]|nr:elongation factor G [Planctomycetota bacterium]
MSDALATSPKELIRNFGIIAHIDAGKTTTTERILYYSGREHRIGEVDAGTTVTDFDKEEQERGITIYAAAVTTAWTCRDRRHQFNIIDTPGHVDFTAEVERSLRVLDGAVVIFCGVEGVEAQSETVWHQADRYEVPRVAFVNKMDRVGADYDRVVKEIRERLRANPLPVVLPCGTAGAFHGVIDIVRMRHLVWDEAAAGARFEAREIPAALRPVADQAREHLCDQLSDVSDRFAEAYLAGDVTEPLLLATLREGTLRRKFVPVLAGASRRNQGVQPLMDAVCEFLPSPLDVPAPVGVNPRTGKTTQCPPPGDDAPTVAFAFKTAFTQHYEFTFLRVYSGTLRERGSLLNSRTGKQERVLRLGRVYADELEPITALGAGDIGAAVSLRDTSTGDTLCDAKHPVALEPAVFPEPVIAVAVEPKSSDDKDRLADVLGKLSHTDPTFRYHLNEETGQLLISGMGELHLEVLINRMARDHRLLVNRGQPSVAYKETVEKAADVVSRFERQSAGKTLFAEVHLMVEPSRAQEAPEALMRASESSIPRQFHDAVLAGLRGSTGSGGRCGFPIIYARATVIGGKATADSNEVAFEAAAAHAFHEAVEKAGTAMLEPVMKYEVRTPDACFGPVSNDLLNRRATIDETEPLGTVTIIRGRVPIAEMFGYSTVLRSLSGGRASYSMEAHSYARVPEEVRRRYLL